MNNLSTVAVRNNVSGTRSWQEADFYAIFLVEFSEFRSEMCFPKCKIDEVSGSSMVMFASDMISLYALRAASRK